MTEQIRKHVGKHIVHIAGAVMVFLIAAAVAKVKTTGKRAVPGITPRICTHASIQSRHAKLIVKLFLFLITQYIVGFRDFFKFTLRCFVSLICIRVVFLGETAVRALDGLIVRVPAHAQNLI